MLAGLSDSERRDLLAMARRRRFGRGEIIFHEGDPGDTLHLVDKGHVAIRVHTPLGDVATTRIIGPGSFFGEFALIAPAPRASTVIALTATETLTIYKDYVDELRAQHPTIDRFLLQAVIGESRRLSGQLLEALYLPVEKRVLRRVLEVSEQFDDGPMPLTQEDIAQLAGTTRPTANRVLKGAEEAGAVEMGRGRIQVLDADWLKKRSR